MKYFYHSLIVICLLFSTPFIAQNFLSAEDSNPKKMGWMEGFPPPKDRIISAIDGSFFKFPALRYSVCHMREFMPTTVVRASTGKTYKFKQKLDNAIDDVVFTPTNSSEIMTWKQSLSKNYTDGILILHKGKIVYEKYFGELSPEGVHAAMSVSKTFTGTLGGLLVAEGDLDENKAAAFYVPELENSAFGNATNREIIDMTTGLKYSEDYSDPKAEVVIVRFASHPEAKNAYIDPTSLPAFYAVAKYLINK